MKWLYDNGCPHDEDVLNNISLGDYEEVDDEPRGKGRKLDGIFVLLCKTK